MSLDWALVAWTKYGLIISFSFKSTERGMDMMDNGSLNSKQIFVELRSRRFVKTGRFVRFGGSTVDLNCSMPVWPRNGSLKWTESESSSVDGLTNQTGRFGSVFKTMFWVLFLGLRVKSIWYDFFIITSYSLFYGVMDSNFKHWYIFV